MDMFQQKHHRSRIWIIVVLAALLVLGWTQRVTLREWLTSNSTTLPPAENASVTNTTTTNTSTNSENVNVSNSNVSVNAANGNTNAVAALPAQKNLNVPFTSQAPLGNWDNAHEEACEEASSLMVASFWKKETLTDKNAIDAELVKIENWEVEKFGYYEDTDAAETAIMLREYFGLTGVVVKPVTSLDDIRREIAAGRPVIVPAAGRELKNPNFSGAGPDYHMIVIKGYLKDGSFITNDPGTRKGADYIYSADILWNALHDWTGVAADGDKVMIVASGA
jgi:hypothetical protein